MFWQKKSPQNLTQKTANSIKGIWLKLKRFLKNERRELHELSSGQETCRRFFCDSDKLLKDFFVPHKGNDFKPKVLRPKNIAYYTFIAVAAKFLVVGFLFFTYPTPAELSAIISANMIALTNQSRVAEGVAPLKENALLDRYAEAKGQDMIARSYFAHDTPEGKRPWEWIDKGTYDYVYAGENLAMDFTNAEGIQDAFMKSPSHKRNIINANYKDVGMAVLTGSIDGHQTTLLVEFFGTQRKDIAGSSLAKKPQVKSEQVPTTEVAKKTSTPKPKTAGASDVEPLTPGNPPITGPDVTNVNQNPQTEGAAPNYGVTNGNPIIASDDSKSSDTLADYVIEYSNIFFIGFLIFMIISLILNVFIKIRVQNPSMILQSVALIALLLAFIIFKFNFIEGIPDHILIL